MFAQLAPASHPAIECPSPFPPRPGISHVIFDFDGTLSWLRHGWPRLMFELFRPYYPARPGEQEAEIYDLLLSEILSLNGKQSIFQMIRFHERVRRRGGACPAPVDLLGEYQRRLDAVIARRVRDLQDGRAAADDFVVCGGRAFLEQLRRRGLQLIILSGTIEPRVREEARWLGLEGFFGRHVYGGTADPAQFSKKLVIDRLLAEEAISGRQMLSFGDGPVEIRETKRAGGLAVAIASDEENNGSGRPDRWKREQLLQAGADAVAADFQAADDLQKMIFGSGSIYPS
jgi:phosphoglycolate phosphatase-like HAD superfamily hydrolase